MTIKKKNDGKKNSTTKINLILLKELNLKKFRKVATDTLTNLTKT